MNHEPMKYCQKHDQPYMAFLSDCPICRGETMTGCGSGVRVPLGPLAISDESVPNKRGLYLTSEQDVAYCRGEKPVSLREDLVVLVPAGKPVQMSLF